MRLAVVTVLTLMLNVFASRGQELSIADSTRYDTTYFVQYPTKLFVGYFQSLQNFVIRIKPNAGLPFTNEHHVYSSGGRTVSGLEVGYDKLFLAANFRTVKNKVNRRGNNSVFNFAVRAGSNKIQVEGLVQRSKGFYDFNSPQYNPAYDAPAPYYRNGGLQANLLRLKVLYFANHRRLAVKAIQGNNFRQLKSAWSPVASVGFYKTKFYSREGILNPEIHSVFGLQSSLYEFRAVGALLGGGFAGTFVFYKNLYLSGIGLVTAEPQFRRYRYREHAKVSQLRASLGTDIRLVLGFNSENFYTGFWANNSIKAYNGNALKINTNLSSVGFSIAYRISIRKEPAWVTRLKDNKYYKML